MSVKRTNYSRMRENKPKETPAQDESRVEDTTTVARKIDQTPVRIRKGPGLEFEHTGKYLEGTGIVRLAEIQNGWGLLKSYEENRDGWVCLDYVKLI